MSELLKPKEIEVISLDGETKTYTISRFPAVAGREIIAKYPLTAIPKVADYGSNEEIMLKLMRYVAVTLDGGRVIKLETKVLVDNHFPDYETLVKVEMEMLRYNTSFFGTGAISNFFADMLRKSITSIAPTLTPLLQQLSVQIKQRLENYKPNIP